MNTSQAIEKKGLAADLSEHMEWLNDFKLDETDSSISFDVNDLFLSKVKAVLGLDREPTQDEVESIVSRAVNLKIVDAIKNQHK